MKYLIIAILLVYIADLITHKFFCWLSVKKNKKKCMCWDCKNPKCNIFDK